MTLNLENEQFNILENKSIFVQFFVSELIYFSQTLQPEYLIICMIVTNFVVFLFLIIITLI